MLTLLEAFLGYQETPLTPVMKTMLDVRRPAGPAKIGLAWFLLGESAWHEGGTEGFPCSFAGYDPKAGVPGSSYCPMLFRPPVSMTSPVISGTPKRSRSSQSTNLQCSTQVFLWIPVSTGSLHGGGINCRTVFSEIMRNGRPPFCTGYFVRREAFRRAYV